MKEKAKILQGQRASESQILYFATVWPLRK